MAVTAQQIKTAKDAGYSDDEIIAHLSSEPTVKTALKAGYKPAEIIGYFQPDTGTTVRQDANYTTDPQVIERERRKFVSKDKGNKTIKDRLQIAADYFTTPNEVNVWEDPLRVIPKSVANTLSALHPASAYAGMSKEAIEASFPGGQPSEAVKKELSQGIADMARGLAAPFGLAGIDAARESWGKNPVGSLLTVAPFVKPTTTTLATVGRKAVAPIRTGLPLTEKSYRTEAGSRLRAVAADERGVVGNGIDEASMKPGDPLSIQKPQAAIEAEAINAAETARLKEKYGIEPTFAQETNSVKAAMLEQSLASKNPDLAEALKYKDAAVNQAGIKSLRSTFGDGKPLPNAPTEQAVGAKILTDIESIRKPAKAKVSAIYQDIPNFQIDNSPLLASVEQVRSVSLPKSQKNKLNEIADYIMDEIGDSTSTGFQELHSIRKTLGTLINDSVKGLSPDNTTAKFAGDLKKTVDAMIDNTPELPEIYNSAKKSYQDYANQFNTGTTAEILQRGNEANGRRLPAEDIPKRFFTETGADDLLRALGPAKAKSNMRQYAIGDLIKRTTDIDGNMNINRSLAWVRQNRSALKKLGLVDEMNGLIRGQVPKALMRQIESKRIDVLSNPVMTMSEARKLLAEYKPALKQLYRDNPEALTKLEDYHKMMQILARNKNVTYGGNSTTVEKGAMSSFFTSAAKTGFNAWASKLSRGLWDVISGYGEKQINAILKDAVMNPDTAKSLMKLAENANDIKAANALSLRLGQLGMGINTNKNQQ